MAPKGVSIRFYGVRGSLPVPGPSTLRTGGNTSCVLYTAGDRKIILDCGSGMRVLANDLMASGQPVRADVFISHYHWDHMMGLPFFYPIYSPGTVLAIHGERKEGLGVKDEVTKQFTGPNFPVERKDLRSKLTYDDIGPGDSLDLDEVHVEVVRLKHPNLCLGFRLEYRGTKVVYTTDHEHGTELDDGLIAFAQGADCLIYDQMYTKAEYEKSARGFGHSCWDEAVRVASAAGVGNLLLYHHDPNRDDDAVDAIEAEATRAFRGAIAAREGFEIEY
ncbi:MAG: MBL fold metallo-hydrolase [Pseudomonadota bacterium]